MLPRKDRTYIAFSEHKKIAAGDAIKVASKVKELLKADSKMTYLILDDENSQQIEIDFRGSVENVTTRLEELFSEGEEKKSGPGRPKLGVTAKEVTLLPDHWEWLSRQPGGASVTLRKLVDEAKKKNMGKDLIRQSQEAAYKFMTTVAGDLPNYEEALRALYAADSKKWNELLTVWPKDVRNHVTKLAEGALNK